MSDPASLLMTVLGGVIASLGALIVFANFVIVRTNYRNHKRGVDRHVSLVPFAGPLLITIGTVPLGLWHAPAATKPIVLAIWVLDPGTLIVLYAIVYVAWKELRKRRGSG